LNASAAALTAISISACNKKITFTITQNYDNKLKNCNCVAEELRQLVKFQLL
jgi:hypothetical protein